MSGSAPTPSTPGVRIGVQLPSVDALDTGRFEVLEVARAAEAAGFDCAWLGDHLAFHAPVIESFVAASAAAAVTTRMFIGFGVLVGPLRHPVWLAKQIGSLQALSGNRLEVGMGVGGEFPGEWEAVGVPVEERGRRMNVLLESLPAMIAGRPARLGPPWDTDVPALKPVGTAPPIWIGGRSDHALRRAVRFGHGWVGTWVDAARVRFARQRLDELGGETLPIAVQMMVNPNPNLAAARAELADYLHGIYRMPFDRVERYTLSGGDADISAGVESLIEAGASTVVLIPGCRDTLGVLPQLSQIAAAVRR